MPVGRLSRPATLMLVRALGRSGRRPVTARLGSRIWALSEGNPFMVVETMQVVDGGKGQDRRSAAAARSYPEDHHRTARAPDRGRPAPRCRRSRDRTRVRVPPPPALVRSGGTADGGGDGGACPSRGAESVGVSSSSSPTTASGRSHTNSWLAPRRDTLHIAVARSWKRSTRSTSRASTIAFGLPLLPDEARGQGRRVSDTVRRGGVAATCRRRRAPFTGGRRSPMPIAYPPPSAIARGST